MLHYRRRVGARGKLVVAAIAISAVWVVERQSASAQVDCSDINVAAADGGSGLNAAIEAADACLGPQTITVEAGTFSQSSPFRVDDGVTIAAAEPLDPPVIDGTTSYAFVVTRTPSPVELRDLDVRGSFRTGMMSIVASCSQTPTGVAAFTRLERLFA